MRRVYRLPVKIGFVINKKIDIYAGYSPSTDLGSSAGQLSIANKSFQV